MRKNSRRIGLLAIVTIPLASGCMSLWPMGNVGQSASNSVSVVREASEVAPVKQSTTPQLAESLEPNLNKSPMTEAEAMAEVMDELQQIGEIDHAAQQQLMVKLRKAKPEQWQLIVKQHQSALAYRQQLLKKESQQLAEQSAPTALTQVSNTTPDSVYSSKESKSPAADTTRVKPKASLAMIGDSASVQQTSPTEVLSAPPNQLPPQVNTPFTPEPTALAAPHRQAVEPVSHVPVATAGSSQEHLQAAIASIQQSAHETPSSVDDVQQQMKLRVMHLLAGQENDAVRPIAGASSTQQDYWSKQMFALSTYLDNDRQPDAKRRAAGSLVHLDSARASLAEIATLHVRNLTFVTSVDGYGVYIAREETKFQPGEQVSLYTEVENFRSNSTKDGYHTQLSTSYEVLDQNDQRVNGAQFPDVEDLCKNQRRDFHMQYGVALPTRIYPGHYKLQLTITDQLSHKIGQTSVPFEIVE